MKLPKRGKLITGGILLLLGFALFLTAARLPHADIFWSVASFMIDLLSFRLVAATCKGESIC